MDTFTSKDGVKVLTINDDGTEAFEKKHFLDLIEGKGYVAPCGVIGSKKDIIVHTLRCKDCERIQHETNKS